MSKKIKIKRSRGEANGELRDVAKAAAALSDGHALTDGEREQLRGLREVAERDSNIQAALAEMTEEEQAVVHIAYYRDHSSSYERAAKDRQRDLVERLLADKDHGYVIEVIDPHDGTSLKGNFQKPKPGTAVDQDKLREILPAKVWEAVTKRAVDQELLEKALADGKITKDQWDQATEETAPRAPHIRITRKGATKK